MKRGQKQEDVGNLLGELPDQGISAPKPQPVLLFANADVQVRKQVRGVEIIGRRYLPLYLKRLQHRLSASEAEKIFETLKLSQSQMFVRSSSNVRWLISSR